MENPSGKIRTFTTHANGKRAVIDVDVRASCPRCAAGKGCGAGLLLGSGGTRQIEAAVNADIDLVEGDTVEIALKPRRLLHAALIVYGAPTLGGATAAAVSYSMAFGDAEAAAAALVGMAIGLLVGRWYLSRPVCINRFVPTIEKRLRGARTGV